MKGIGAYNNTYKIFLLTKFPGGNGPGPASCWFGYTGQKGKAWLKAGVREERAGPHGTRKTRQALESNPRFSALGQLSRVILTFINLIQFPVTCQQNY